MLAEPALGQVENVGQIRRGTREWMSGTEGMAGSLEDFELYALTARPRQFMGLGDGHRLVFRTVHDQPGKRSAWRWFRRCSGKTIS